MVRELENGHVVMSAVTIIPVMARIFATIWPWEALGVRVRGGEACGTAETEP